MRTTVALLITFGLTSVIACDKPSPPSTKSVTASEPDWLRDIDVQVAGTRAVFATNTEVLLELKNGAMRPAVIHGLDAPKAAELVRQTGILSPIHRLSVGVAKPIALKPGEKRRVSLLFEAGEGEPRSLRLYGKEWAL